MNLFRLTIRLMYVIAGLWVLFGVAWFFRDSDYRVFYFVTALGYAFVLAVCAHYLSRRHLFAWWVAVIFLGLNILLTLADEFGWFDVVYLFPSVIVFVLVLVLKKEFLSPKKLFLLSSNIDAGLQKEFITFVGKNPRGMRCAFIPTAADPEEDNRWIHAVRNSLIALGIQAFDIDLKTENEKTLKEKLSSADMVYVNGGNTFYLLYWIRRSGFDRVIIPLVTSGRIIYIGTSAGSYVAGPTIEQAHWKHHDKDIVGIEDLTALSLVPFLTFAHYTEEWREALEEGKHNTSYEVIVLRDGEAVQVVGHEVRKLGTEG